MCFYEKSYTIEEYFNSEDCPKVYFSKGGAVNANNSHKIPSLSAFVLKEKDYYYDKRKNEIVLNLSMYFSKEVLCLLERLFIPLDNMSFNLTEAMNKEKTRLVLVNEIVNIKEEVKQKVYDFFKKINITPDYNGEWD